MILKFILILTVTVISQKDKFRLIRQIYSRVEPTFTASPLHAEACVLLIR